MKNIFKYIFIGFVQGITEFLPVSSSGHIVLFGSFFELDNLLLLSIVAHIGTLFAVLFVYRKEIFSLVHHPKNKTNLHLILATIPTIVIVLIFNKFFENSFKISTLIFGFLISAVLLFVADLKKDGNKYITSKNSTALGFAQGLAVLPGLSRSGTTLAFGMMLGIEKERMLNFSFLMSIPIIIASAVYESFSLFSCQLSVDWLSIFVVMITSFIFGILSIKVMLKIVNKNKLYYFSFYLILLSIISLIIL